MGKIRPRGTHTCTIIMYEHRFQEKHVYKKIIIITQMGFYFLLSCLYSFCNHLVQAAMSRSLENKHVSQKHMAAPRYIDRDDVDSNSMYYAALYSYTADRLLWDQLELHGNLTMVVHNDRMGIERSTTAVNIVRCIPCKRGICCNRCKNGEGGYEFRWLSPIWCPMYVKNANKGSWLPGKSETRWRRPVTCPSMRMISLHGLSASSNCSCEDHEILNDSKTSNSDGPPPIGWSDSDNARISRNSTSSSNDEEPF